MFTYMPMRVGVVLFAGWVIGARSAPAVDAISERAVLISARRSALVDAPLQEPQPASCPYHFRSDMPAATFCMYRGVALGSDGAVCANDVVAIWSSFALEAVAREDGTKKTRGSEPGVHLAFVAEPEIVLRAIADSHQGDHAVMVGYTLGSNRPQPLAGTITLQIGAPSVLRLELATSGRSGVAGCALASYVGAYFGLLQPEAEAMVAADAGVDSVR